MNAIATTAPRPPGRLRMAAQRVISKAFPTWVYPGPVTAGGIFTQDAGFVPWCFDLNFWQEGYRGARSPECATVEAGVSAYAQTAAMLPGYVWRRSRDGGREAVTDSPLARILRKPNGYQTRSDFVLNVVRAFYLTGNSYCYAERDPRTDEVIALHPLLQGMCKPYIDPETQEVFYSMAPADWMPRDGDGWPFLAINVVPARFVWHLKFQTPRNPFIGETPLQAAYPAIASQVAINEQQGRFFANMSRPSGTLNTDMVLTKGQVNELRELWREQSSGLNIGGVPILSAGLKWQSMSLSAADAELIEFYKLSTGDIARVLRIPLPLIGVEGTTPSSAEVLMQFWIASGLGFLLEHLEMSLDKFFELPADQYSEFDTVALLRSNFKERIEGIVRGVQGGVYTPNEGRAAEGLARVDDGDEPRMQQQVVPLTYWSEKMALDKESTAASIRLQDAQAAAAAAPPPPPPPPPAPTPDPAPDPAADETRALAMSTELRQRIGNLRHG